MFNGSVEDYLGLGLERSVLDDLNRSVLDDLNNDVSGSVNSYRAPIGPLADDVPCFLKGTKISTTRGEVNIEDLKVTDKLINYLGNNCNIIKISSFKRDVNKNTHPYVILKGTKINKFTCNRDLYLSKDHAVLVNNKYFVEAKHLPFAKQVTTLECEQYEYYHIITENFLEDTVISNGVPTESFSHNIPRHTIPFMYRNKIRILQQSSARIEEEPKINHLFNMSKRTSSSKAHHITKIKYN